MRSDEPAAGGRFARWQTGWALALRMARRDVRRHRARSLLILVMVGVPVALIAGGIAGLNSLHSSRFTTLPHTLGSTQARLQVTDRRVEQDFEVRSLGSQDGPEPIPGAAPGGRPTAADVQRLTGGRLIPVEQSSGIFPDGVGVGQVLGVDGRDGATAGMVRLVSGRWPTTPDEVAVTPYGVRRGLPDHGELTYRLDTQRRTVRVVGVADGWTPEARAAHLVTLPEALQDAASSARLGFGFDTPGRTYLLAREAPVTWAEVRSLNRYGLLVLSREVVTDPPPASELPPLMRGVDTRVADGSLPLVVIGGVAMVLVTTLLAGPAFAVSATRQRHTLALSAVNGAPGRQLRRMVLAQAVVLGGLGATASAGVGVGLAWAILSVQRARGMDLPDLPLTASPTAIGAVVLIATLAALLAAALPARGLRRLDLVPALRGAAPAGAPRRRTPVLGLTLVGLGTVIMVGCGIAMSRRAGGDTASYGAAAGAVILVVGALFVLPTALVWIGRRAAGAPLPLRMAARDAARQRSRSGPATAAVLATVAAVTAILISGGSGAVVDEARYVTRAPLGAARIDIRPDGPDVAAARPEVDRVIPGAATVLLADPWHGPSRGENVRPGKPQRRLSVLPAGCPVRAAFDRAYARDLAGDPPPGPNGTAPELPCGGVSTQLGGDLLLIDRAGVAAVPGLPDEVRRTLTDGGVVTYRPELGHDGGARLVTALVTWYPASGPGEAERPPIIAEPTDQPLATAVARKADLAGLARDGRTPPAVLTLQTAIAAGLSIAPNTALVIGPDGAPLSAEQEGRLMDTVAGLGMYAKVERGYQSPTAVAFAMVLAITLFIVLVAALTSTALSLAEQEADLATLTAIGASLRARRLMAGAQALVVAGLGTVSGVALGFVPGIAMCWPATATRWDPETHIVSWTDPTIVIPWLPLLGLLLVVPAIAAGLAAAGVRRTPALSRRMA